MAHAKGWRSLLGLLALLPALFVAFALFQGGHALWGVAFVSFVALTVFVYTADRAYTYRYLLPSFAAFAVFVILPLIYTLYIAFTNYSATNMMSYGEVRAFLLRERDVNPNRPWLFTLHEVEQDEFALVLHAGRRGDDGAGDSYLSESFRPPVREKLTLALHPGDAHERATRELSLRETIALRHALSNIELLDPELGVPLRFYSFNSFVPSRRVWMEREEDRGLLNLLTGEVLLPDFVSGHFRNEQGRAIGPGFRTRIGWDNFAQLFTNEAVRGPFLKIFAWTIVFAAFSVFLTFVVGFLLAVLLEWKPLRGRKVWRSLIILPYAVPAFISILIFRGLFNPQFGEINMVLHALFGIRPDWTNHVLLARTMVLLVNLWLGYPYMMILCTGILQSVPGDIYEASAIDGCTPFSLLYRITLPLILPPLRPLLVASFAFNFNNFLLIQLLTGGGPRIPDAATAVGYTDILVTYTFNLAFRDSGANFGFAAAIATIIFIIITILSYANLRAAARNSR